MLLGLGHWQAGVGFHVTFTGAVVAASLAVIRWLAVRFPGPWPTAARSSALQHLTSFDARRERCGRRGFQRVLSLLIPHPVLTGVVKMQAIVHRSHDFPHYTGKISGPVASWRAHLRAGNSEHPSHAGFIAYYQPESIRHFLYTLLLLKQPVRK